MIKSVQEINNHFEIFCSHYFCIQAIHRLFAPSCKCVRIHGGPTVSYAIIT